MAEKRKKSAGEVDSADAESTNEPTIEAEEGGAVEEVAPAEAEADEPVTEVAAEAEQPAVNEPEAETHAPAEAEESVAEVAAEAEQPEVEAEAATEASAEAETPEPAAAGPPVSASAPAEALEPKRKRKRLPRALRPLRTKAKTTKPATRKPIVRLEKPEHDRGRRQERQGTVVSSAMDKTIVVKVDTLKAHPKYKKVVRRSTTFHAHDEANQANVGDVVRIVETRPLSKTKRWRLAEIVEAAK